MITLLQILKHLTSESDRAYVLEWCAVIAEEPATVYDFADDMDENYNIELSEVQMERLAAVCKSGKYKSAFEVTRESN
jgi:hypothetical protein